MSTVDLLTLAMALSVSTLWLLGVLGLVWWLDRYDREPVRLVLLAVLWGATVAPALAVLIEGAVAAAARATWGGEVGTFLVVGGYGPLIEELLKGLGVLLMLAFSRHFDNPTDGMVYGTAAGLGFAITENSLYGLAHVAAGNGSAVGLIAVRTAFSAGVHAVSSASFGGMIGLAYLARKRLSGLLLVAGGVVVAVALHAGWNVVQVTVLGARLPAVSAAMVGALCVLHLLVLALFLRLEHRVLLDQLAEEVRLGVLPVWVVEVIPYWRRRVTGGWMPTRRERTVLASLLTRLAFRKHVLTRRHGSDRELEGLEVMRLRERARHMLFPAETSPD